MCENGYSALKRLEWKRTHSAWYSYSTILSVAGQKVASAHYAVPWDQMEEAYNALILEAEDNAGNITSVNLCVVSRDTIAPYPVMYDVENSVLYRDFITSQNQTEAISWVDRGDIGIAGVEKWLYYWGQDPNGTSATQHESASLPPFTVPAGTAGNGIYRLRVSPLDRAGNQGEWQPAYKYTYYSQVPARWYYTDHDGRYWYRSLTDLSASIGWFGRMTGASRE